MIKFTKKVEVYNKNGAKIAVFAPPTNITTPEATKELMIDPIVKMEQNGSSTLEFSIDQNSEKWDIISDPENRYVVDGKEFIPFQEGAYEFKDGYVSVIAVESWYELGKMYVQAYNVNDTKVDPVDEHTVKLLPKSTGNLYVNGKRYNNNPYPRGSAGYNLWALLQGSGWSLGICDVMVDGFSAADDYGVFNIETDMETLLDNILNIQKLYGGILVWDSINKIVDLRDEEKWDTDIGFEARMGKNLKSEPVVTQNNDIVTKLYPLGRDYLNIKAVNSDKTYLENYSYTDTVYSKILQNSDIYDQKQLKYWGQRQLKKMCKPTRSISAEIIDRRLEPGYETEEFDLNSIVTVYYTSPEGKQTKEKQRVVSWEYYVFDPENSKIELGNKVRNDIEILKQSFDMGETASSKFTSSGTISSGTVYVPTSYGGDYSWGGGSLSNYLVNNEKEINLTVTNLNKFKDETGENFAKTQASIGLVADDLKAQITLEASHYKETSQGVSQNKASITAVADDLKAQVTLEASHYKEVNGKITSAEASITATAKELSAEVALRAKVVDNNGNIKAAEIVTAVNATGSSVKIKADHINLDGVTTFVRSAGGSGASAYWSGRDFIWRLGSGNFSIQGYLSVSNGAMFYGSINTQGGTGRTDNITVSTGLTSSTTLKFYNGILVQ